MCGREREPESDDGDGENEIFGLHLQLAAKVRMRKGCSPFYLPDAGAEYNRLSTGCIIRYHRSSHPLYPARPLVEPSPAEAARPIPDRVGGNGSGCVRLTTVITLDAAVKCVK